MRVDYIPLQGFENLDSKPNRCLCSGENCYRLHHWNGTLLTPGRWRAPKRTRAFAALGRSRRVVHPNMLNCCTCWGPHPLHGAADRSLCLNHHRGS